MDVKRLPHRWIARQLQKIKVIGDSSLEVCIKYASLARLTYRNDFLQNRVNEVLSQSNKIGLVHVFIFGDLSASDDGYEFYLRCLEACIKKKGYVGHFKQRRASLIEDVSTAFMTLKAISKALKKKVRDVLDLEVDIGNGAIAVGTLMSSRISTWKPVQNSTNRMNGLKRVVITAIMDRLDSSRPGEGTILKQLLLEDVEKDASEEKAVEPGLKQVVESKRGSTKRILENIGHSKPVKKKAKRRGNTSKDSLIDNLPIVIRRQSTLSKERLYDDSLPSNPPSRSLPTPPPANWKEYSSKVWPFAIPMSLQMWRPAYGCPEVDVSVFLKQMFMPQDHRAHVALRSRDLIQMREHLHYQLAIIEAQNLSYREIDTMVRLKADHLRVDKTSFQRMEREVAAMPCVNGIELTMTALNRKRFELDTYGFTVLEDLVCGDKIYNDALKGSENSLWFSKLFSFMEKKENSIPNALPVRIWWDTILGPKGEGSGIQMSSHGASADWVEGRKASSIWKEKAKLETLLAMIAATLRLGNQDENGKWDLQVPHTGGRFLRTLQKAVGKTLHTDFAFEPTETGLPAKQPGYFMMVSGAEGFPLWVVPKSHIDRNGGENSHLTTGKAAEVVRIFVKSESVLIGRGDLVHASASSADGIRGHNLRFHLMLLPNGLKMTNETYHTEPLYKPNFREYEQDAFI